MIHYSEDRPWTLTFYAEDLADEPSEKAVPELTKLLQHKDPVVREGALYGASVHIENNGELMLQVKGMAKNDENKTVRQVAIDSLKNIGVRV